jgi:hypothetical protein
VTIRRQGELDWQIKRLIDKPQASTAFRTNPEIQHQHVKPRAHPTRCANHVPPLQVDIPACDEQRRYKQPLKCPTSIPEFAMRLHSLTASRILRPPPRPRQRRQNNTPRADQSDIHIFKRQSPHRAHCGPKCRYHSSSTAKSTHLPQDMGRRRSA